MSHTVVRAWTAVYPDPIRVAQGDVVSVGRPDDGFPGWSWCTDPQGRAGWLPEAWVDGGRALRDYDARELCVAVDDPVDVLEEHAGWSRCRAADGSTGWIPTGSTAPTALVARCDAWLEAWTGGDPSDLLTFYSEDATYRDPATTLAGRAALAVYFRKLLGRNPRWTWRRAELIPTANGFTLKWRARIPVGTTIVEEEGLDIVELRDGLITRNEVFFDRAALLAAVRQG